MRLAWDLTQHENRSSSTYLGAGVHEYKMVAVEPQKDRSRKSKLAHSQYHIHSVAKEGQLGRGLCGQRDGTRVLAADLWACLTLLPRASEG